MRVIESLLKDVPLPRMVKVRQSFPAPEVADVPGAVREAVAAEGVLERISEGDRVAIAVGSRGVADIDVMTREVVRLVRSRGGQPFIPFPWAATGGQRRRGRFRC